MCNCPKYIICFGDQIEETLKVLNATHDPTDCDCQTREESSETDKPGESAWDELNYCQNASEIDDWMRLYESDLKRIPRRD